MLELMLCSMLTVFPDYLYRRYVQGKRLGKEINLYTVWFELRWGIVAMPRAHHLADHDDLLLPPVDEERHRDLPQRHHPARGLRSGVRGLCGHQREGQGRPAAVPARRCRAAGGGGDGPAAHRRGGGGDGGGRERARDGGRPDRGGAQLAGAGAGGARRPDRAPAAQSRHRRPARDRAAAGGGRRPPGLARRGARQQGDAADPHRLGAAGAEGERRGRARAGPGRARQDAGQGWRGRHGPAVHAAPRRRRQPDHPNRRHPRPRRVSRRTGRRLRSDRGAGDEGRHDRRGHLHRQAFRHPADGGVGGAERDCRRPDPADRPADRRPADGPAGDDHRVSRAALPGRADRRAAGQQLHRQRLHQQPRRARGPGHRHRRGGSSCTSWTPSGWCTR